MDKAKQWVALAAAAALLLAAGGWFLLVQPQRDEAAQLREQADVQVSQNVQLETQLDVLRAKAAGLPEQQADLDEAAAHIPPEAELPELVRALTSAARAAGVELAALTPGAPLPVGPEAATTQAAAGAPAGLAAVPLTLRVTGDFYELEQFVAALEDLPRATRVTGLSLSDAEDTRGRVLTGTITASVYLSGSADAAATPGAPAAAPTMSEPAGAVAGPTAPAADGTAADPSQPVSQETP